MLEAGRGLGGKLGKLALWLMPLTIILEWVGGTFAKPVWGRVLYLALYLALFWLAPLAPARSAHNPLARRIVGALCVAGGLAVFGIAAALRFPRALGPVPLALPTWLAGEAWHLMLPLLAAWPLALGCTLIGRTFDEARAYERLGLFVGLGFLLSIAANVHVQGLPVVLRVPLTRWLLAIDAAVLLAVALVPRVPHAARLGLILAAGFALRVLGIEGWEIDPRVRDMLALVASAQERFAEGRNPYAIYAMQHGSELPLTYLPGLWLGYAVPRLAGLDLRLMGPLAEVALFALLSRATKRLDAAQRTSAQALIASFAAVWLFSPSVQWNVVYAEPMLWWCVLGALFALTFSNRFGAAAVVLGYAMATRHFALVLAPFVLVYFVRMRGLRGALPYVAGAGAVAALLLTPFVAADPELFWFGTLRWLREYGPAHFPWFLDRFGFLQVFHERGALAQLPLAQWGSVALCLIGAMRARVAYVPRFAATALLLFIMLNVLIWDSFLLDGAMAALGVVLTRPLAGRAVEAPLASARAVRGAQLALAATVLAGGYLAWTLVATMRVHDGREVHDFVKRATQPGDFIIDRSDRRIAFVHGTWLLRREEVPAPIGGELYDAAWGGGIALHAPGKVWLITEALRDAPLREAFSRLGTPRDAQAFDWLHVQAITPHRMRLARLARAEPDVAPQRCAVGPTFADMVVATVSAERPVRVSLEPEQLGQGVLLAAGFPNEDVVWPRQRVALTLHVGDRAQPPLEVENLHGLQWQVIGTPGQQGKPAPLTIALSTDDPLPRRVCLELIVLHAR